MLSPHRVLDRKNEKGQITFGLNWVKIPII